MKGSFKPTHAASDLRDQLLPIFRAALKKPGYLVTTKEGGVDAIVGNYRCEILSKEEVKNNDLSRVEARFKKLWEMA